MQRDDRLELVGTESRRPAPLGAGGLGHDRSSPRHAVGDEPVQSLYGSMVLAACGGASVCDQPVEHDGRVEQEEIAVAPRRPVLADALGEPARDLVRQQRVAIEARATVAGPGEPEPPSLRVVIAGAALVPP